MINEVKKDNITFADAYTKFEAGTMQTAEVVAFAEAINFIKDLGIKNIASHENEILQYGLEKLRKPDGFLRLWGPSRTNRPLASSAVSPTSRTIGTTTARSSCISTCLRRPTVPGWRFQALSNF